MNSELKELIINYHNYTNICSSEVEEDTLETHFFGSYYDKYRPLNDKRITSNQYLLNLRKIHYNINQVLMNKLFLNKKITHKFLDYPGLEFCYFPNQNSFKRPAIGWNIPLVSADNESNLIINNEFFDKHNENFNFNYYDLTNIQYNIFEKTYEIRLIFDYE